MQQEGKINKIRHKHKHNTVYSAVSENWNERDEGGSASQKGKPKE